MRVNETDRKAVMVRTRCDAAEIRMKYPEAIDRRLDLARFRSDHLGERDNEPGWPGR
jgi:hypothetical protein